MIVKGDITDTMWWLKHTKAIDNDNMATSTIGVTMAGGL